MLLPISRIVPDPTDNKSTVVQVMAWCRQATSHYLNHSWPSSMMPMASPGCNELRLLVGLDLFNDEWVKGCILCVTWRKLTEYKNEHTASLTSIYDKYPSLLPITLWPPTYPDLLGTCSGTPSPAPRLESCQPGSTLRPILKSTPMMDHGDRL